ncbi:pentapeptide repeat-containing protein [Streptomyces goshikiensis]|uniref:pentapeptide repeat-containing protein n=1 Tax=Streptomyces goshikiensis TaxID=1942 RepID=UPI0037B07753
MARPSRSARPARTRPHGQGGDGEGKPGGPPSVRGSPEGVLRRWRSRIGAPRQLSFTRCSFRGADVRQATLDGCRFKLWELTTTTGIKLDDAVLRDVQLDRVIGWPLTG